MCCRVVNFLLLQFYCGALPLLMVNLSRRHSLGCATRDPRISLRVKGMSVRRTMLCCVFLTLIKVGYGFSFRHHGLSLKAS